MDRYLNAVITKYIPPFLMSKFMYETLAERPGSMDGESFPQRMPSFPFTTQSCDNADRVWAASWTFAKKSMDGEMMPQAIAHRGYKAVHPENTMASFRGAVEIGANAIETDIHLSKDGEVVLSHVSCRESENRWIRH
jgi:hypothetical protein